MKVQVDDNNYLTGTYVILGDMPNSVEISGDLSDKALEIFKEDIYKATCYKLVDNNTRFEFDKEKYKRTNDKVINARLIRLKDEVINRSKTELKRYLDTIKLESDVYKGIKKLYTVSLEKQQMLTNTIITALSDDNLSYNATGESDMNDWTIAELKQLAYEIQQFIRPSIQKQKDFEVKVNKTTSIEELESLEFTL